MIKVENLRKDYETVRALNDISFTIKKGAFFALLGPNGAGKTTAIEILSTLKQKDGGTITIDNAQLDRDDAAIRNNIGVVFQYSTMDGALTVNENLIARGGLYGLNKHVLEERIETVSKMLDIAPYLSQRFNTLSGGQKRRVDVARALLNEPAILMLDEPTTGLDPTSRENLWSLIMDLKAKTDMTILLTTHYMDEVLDCDHVVIIDKGEIVAEDSADRLRLRYAKDKLKLIAKDNTLETALQKAGTEYQKIQSTIHILLDSPFTGLSIIERHKPAIESFEIVKGNMDDVFLNITGRKLRE